MLIAFYKGQHRLFNKLVAWKTEGPYSHCEAVFERTAIYLDKPYSQHMCASSSFLDGGVRFKPIDLNPEDWDIMDVPALDEQKVRAWFKDHEGEPYDVRGLVSFIIPVGHTKEGWFCDEALLAAAGMPEPNRFDPNSCACVLLFIGGTWAQKSKQQGVDNG